MRNLFLALLVVLSVSSCDDNDYTEPTQLERVSSEAMAWKMIDLYPTICRDSLVEAPYTEINPAGLEAFAKANNFNQVRVVAAAYPANWEIKELAGKPTLLIQMRNTTDKRIQFYHAPACCPPPGNCRAKLREFNLEADGR